MLLMVAGHVIGNEPSRGLQAPDGSFLRWAYIALEDIRIPFFTVISGWVYAMRPLAPGSDIGLFLRRKVRRILLPMTVVGLLMLAGQSFVPGVNSGAGLARAADLFVYGVEHLWFLQAIFLVFLLISWLDTRRVAWSPRGWTALVLGALVVAATVHIPLPYAVFSVNGALWLLPFFLVGVGLARFGVDSAPPWLTGALGAGALILLAAEPLRPSLEQPIAARAIGLLTGLVGILALYFLRRWLTTRWLAWVGGFAYGIYLLHVFGAAGARIVLTRLGVDSTPVLFAVGLLLAVSLPVAFELTLGRSALVATCVFGKAWRPGGAPRGGPPTPGDGAQPQLLAMTSRSQTARTDARRHRRFRAGHRSRA